MCDSQPVPGVTSSDRSQTHNPTPNLGGRGGNWEVGNFFGGGGKMGFFFVFPSKTCRVDAFSYFLQSPVGWPTFCQNWSPCHYFSWNKLKFHFFFNPDFIQMGWKSAVGHTLQDLMVCRFLLASVKRSYQTWVFFTCLTKSTGGAFFTCLSKIPYFSVRVHVFLLERAKRGWLRYSEQI